MQRRERRSGISKAAIGVNVPVVNKATGMVKRIALSPNHSDAASIIVALNNLAKQFGQMSAMREFVVGSVLCTTKNNDVRSWVRDIVDFVRKHLRYVADPIGTEYVVSPLNILPKIIASQTASGDCDDHTLLAASMLLSVGVPTVIVGVKIKGGPLFDHVIIASLIDGRYHDIDPCDKFGVNPRYTEKLIP